MHFLFKFIFKQHNFIFYIWYESKGYVIWILLCLYVLNIWLALYDDYGTINIYYDNADVRIVIFLYCNRIYYIFYNYGQLCPFVLEFRIYNNNNIFISFYPAIWVNLSFNPQTFSINSKEKLKVDIWRKIFLIKYENII